MKKQIATTIAALLAMTTLSAPARANDDMIRLGVGIAGALIGEAMKGGNKRQGAQPRRGDKLIGRVGEGRQQKQNNVARTRNKVAPAAGAAGAATVAAIALPAVGPMIEGKPDPAAVIDTTTTAAVSGTDFVLPTSEESDRVELVAVSAPAGVEIMDENGIVWGTSTAENAEKIAKAEKMGFKPSAVIASITGLQPPKVEAKPAAPKMVGLVDLIDDDGMFWTSVTPGLAQKVEDAVSIGVPRVDAIKRFTGLKRPSKNQPKATKAPTEADIAAVKIEVPEPAMSAELSTPPVIAPAVVEPVADTAPDMDL